MSNLTRLRAAVEDYARKEGYFSTARGFDPVPHHVVRNYEEAVSELFLAAKEVCKDV